MEYIKANEAKALANKARAFDGSYLREETDQIFANIREEAEAGEMSFDVDELDDVIIRRLTDCGFRVLHENYNKTFSVSWEHANDSN